MSEKTATACFLDLLGSLLGLKFLKKYDQISNISAICLPGVGNSEILKEVAPICQAHNSLILTSESDLYDYLTSN